MAASEGRGDGAASIPNGRFPIDQLPSAATSGGGSWSQAPTAGFRSLTGAYWRVRDRRPRAETGPSMDRDRTPGVDPLRSAYGLAIGSALILAEDAGRLAIVTCPGRKRCAESGSSAGWRRSSPATLPATAG